MHTVVPFDASEPKTRLTPVLDAGERSQFATAMLRDVLGTLRAAGHTPEVLATAAVDVQAPVPVTVDEQPLTPAVNTVLAADEEPVLVVMADLPLVTPEAVRLLTDADAELALAPGLGGGTNAFCSRHPGFRVDYHDGSYRKHRRRAAACGASTTTVDSFRLALDADEPDDLVEVLLHGEGHAETWLREAGFELETGERGLTAVR